MKEVIRAVMMVIAVIVILSLIMALPTMLLWNWLMPDIFSLPKIGFFQALGLVFLAKILFSNDSGSSEKD